MGEGAILAEDALLDDQPQGPLAKKRHTDIFHTGVIQNACLTIQSADSSDGTPGFL